MNFENLKFVETTNDIKVTVMPSYNLQGSNANENMFIWFYNVRIENLSDLTIQVLSRHWQVFDSSGKNEEIKGEGLVGYQPIIKPKEFFEYKSQVRLFSQSGLMRGEYFAVNLNSKDQFAITIPAFSLDVNVNHQTSN
jgi:ApaG protein